MSKPVSFTIGQRVLHSVSKRHGQITAIADTGACFVLDEGSRDGAWCAPEVLTVAKAISFTAAKRQAAALSPAMTICRTGEGDELRVSFAGLTRAQAEPSAYYTDDPQDALDTARAMAARGVPQINPCAGSVFIFSASHVENAPADMVQDHCNGDDEMLLGVALDATSTVSDVYDALVQEFHALAENSDWQEEDYEAAEAALRTCFDGMDSAAFFWAPQTDADMPSEDDAPHVQAWFRLTWEEV